MGDDRAKALEVYQKFQEQDIAILDSERSLYDWANKQTNLHRTCQYDDRGCHDWCGFLSD